MAAASLKHLYHGDPAGREAACVDPAHVGNLQGFIDGCVTEVHMVDVPDGRNVTAIPSVIDAFARPQGKILDPFTHVIRDELGPIIARHVGVN